MLEKDENHTKAYENRNPGENDEMREGELGQELWLN